MLAAAPPEEGSISPIPSKGKPANVGKEARWMLADEKCMHTEETTTPATLFKVFKRILARYDSSILEDLHLLLQAFAVLLQEGTGGEQLTSKAISVVADKVEERLEITIEKTMNKMSSTVESLLANQKDIQTSTSALSKTAETYNKLTEDMCNNVKAATEMSDKLTNIVSSYKEALLNDETAAPQQQHQGEKLMQVNPKPQDSQSKPG
ncbi:hypothetical protein EI94DRAFT_1794409 [Lactarius quietus]|nr:hypothetical protein EI94DRAFT_1794409 [Lactarius quietus]